ncbi:MAG: glucosamine-6-phosphate deaminase [Octadecabacter sp.]
MRVVICDTAQSATERVAEIVADQVQQTPDSVLGLATGGTMEALYALLVTAHGNGLSFAQIKSFNLDEYVGLPPDHPQSYARYMQHHAFDHVDIAPENTFLPNGTDDPVRAAHHYEDLIAQHGPIDLQVLGLGHNGHIGFNEPGSSLTSRTREKALSVQTLDANSRFFSQSEDMPKSAVTMGIGTIMDSRRIVLLAHGGAKARAVQAMIEGPISAFCPASILQMHRTVTVVIDQDAAQNLQLKEHYMRAETLQRVRDKRA